MTRAPKKRIEIASPDSRSILRIPENKPSQAVAVTLLQAGYAAEDALRLAGYRFATAAGARSKASKLLRTAPDTASGYGSDHPAVAALTPALRSKFFELAPAVRAHTLYYYADDLAFELAAMNPTEENSRLTGDVAPGGKWDKVARGVQNA